MENFYVKINEEFISITDLIKHYKVMKEQSIINEEFTKTLPKTITHNEIEMVLVPAGNFIYGSNEKPQQIIYLPDYYIGKYPVTNTQYKIFIDSTKYKNHHIYITMKFQITQLLMFLGMMHKNFVNGRMSVYQQNNSGKKQQEVLMEESILGVMMFGMKINVIVKSNKTKQLK